MKITPKQTSKPDVVIEMTAREFQALFEVSHRIAGNPEGPRGFFDLLIDGGKVLGFERSNYLESDNSLYLVSHWPEDQD